MIESPSLLSIPRSELRAILERASSGEIAIATRMQADLAAVVDAPDGERSRENIWRLRPTWAWVWTSEAIDAASWARAVRWVQQVADKRSDPAPVARFLALFAARRGSVEAQARLDRSAQVRMISG